MCQALVSWYWAYVPPIEKEVGVASTRPSSVNVPTVLEPEVPVCTRLTVMALPHVAPVCS